MCASIAFTTSRDTAVRAGRTFAFAVRAVDHWGNTAASPLAVTSDRPYKAAWGPAESMAQMAQWAKSGQFDNSVFQAFVKSLGIYPVGSLVRLSSGRLGVVIEQHAAALLKPVVKIFFSAISQMYVRPETLDLSRLGCNERVVERESNRRWKFKHLEQMWAGDTLLQIGR